MAVKKPFLKLKQRMNRIRLAEEHKDWDAHKWSSVVFSDECVKIIADLCILRFQYELLTLQIYQSQFNIVTNTKGIEYSVILDNFGVWQLC